MSLYTRAVLLQPPKVAGVRLRPFSLWHAQVLQALDSPLATGKEFQLHDLIEIILVCKDRQRDNLKSYLRFINSKAVRFCWWLRWLFTDTNQAHNELVTYYNEYTKSPDAWPSGDNSGFSAIDPPFKTATVIAMYMGGVKLSDVWDMPYCLAMCYRASIMEENGVDIVDEKNLMIADNAEEIFKQGGMHGRGQSQSIA